MRHRLSIALMLAASQACAQGAAEPTRATPGAYREALRPEVHGTVGVVAAGRDTTASAAVRMLAAGGNATDAGVAAVFAAAVTEISHFGLGGEAMVMIHDVAAGHTDVIDGQGPAPKAATPAVFAAQGRIDGNGPRAATVPAVVDAMALALAEHGTMRLAEVLQPAIAFADGFAMYPFLEGFLASEKAATERWPDSTRTYYPDGRVTPTGAVFRQPNLAATLRAIAAADEAAFAATHDRNAAIEAGRAAFYQGDIARRIAAATQAAGGLLTYEDLAAYRGRIERPVETRFAGFTVQKAAWSQGPALLEALNILGTMDLKAMGAGSVGLVHSATEAIKLAYDDRDAFLGDADFSPVPMAGLLSPDYAAAREREIGHQASIAHRLGDPFAFDPAVKPPPLRYTPHPARGSGEKVGDTTAIEVADAKGNLFSATPSSGWLLGGAFIAGDTGVPMGNRMQVFDLDPASPNVLAPGKRPRTTLTPTIVLKEGKPMLAIGTPGGDSQDQQILNVLLNRLVFGMPLQRAIDAPRFNSLHFHSSFAAHKDEPGVLEVEADLGEPVLAELKRREHRLRVLPPLGIAAGVVAVGVEPGGTLVGAADPRRERVAFGW